ncbi:MAG: beta-aspartyl-peptidase, partial [Pseudomonadales bacterium]|nr:beta-aspartyl-peptidase [Pseudomonadales bacterium]
MIKLIRNAQVHSPTPLGVCDILIADKRIVRIDEKIEINGDDVEIIDAHHRIVAPGLVDSLVHISGGGGEGGYATRTPELNVVDAVKAGVTTVIGALGTDATTRTLGELHGKAKALNEQGISCFHYTGAYQVPVPTMTGNIRNDMIYIDTVIGVGELAISDHRSSQPTAHELARIAADTHVAGLLSGKKGVVSIHVGDHDQHLNLLHQVVEEFPESISQFYPTHM